MDLASQHQVEFARRRLITARDQLQALEHIPRTWQAQNPNDSYMAELQAKRPHLLRPLTILGKLGNVRPSLPLFEHTPTAVDPWLWTAYPLLLVWPGLVPSIDGISLLDRPSITALPGLSLYLEAVWSIDPAAHTLGCSSARLFFDGNAELEFNNDYSTITTPTTRTWVHRIGRVTETEIETFNDGSIPFVPTALS